ncbi:hypothetical protein EX30DRAFT_341195 [Ascodesmis nigricans]|uniref:Uncharacterized protein n=1 Tax=Ascodesmis nigricans TaxID=341454 RepID=A0A4S2MW61_9PEZI|nr:hypothetical protein EX30DRAFT_341195 [Ascodesmis nigricans]
MALQFASPFTSSSSPSSKRKRTLDDAHPHDAFNTNSSYTPSITPIAPSVLSGGSGQVSGRTMKRIRNGRPSEEAVYQYTLQKLFSAGKQVSSSGYPVKTILSESTLPSSTTTTPTLPPHHTAIPSTTSTPLSEFLSFFNRRPSTPFPTAPAPKALFCSDCDAAVTYSETEGEESVCCVGCRRVVCGGGCSTSNGEGRVCVECIPRWC